MEVQAYEVDAGVLDGVDERVGVLVSRDVLLKRPPELDRVEPGRLRRRGPLKQRQFCEENRAVHVEPQPIRPHRGSYLAFHPCRAAEGHIRGTWPSAASMIVLVSWLVSGYSPTYVFRVIVGVE
jgi:hypothetical protein